MNQSFQKNKLSDIVDNINKSDVILSQKNIEEFKNPHIQKNLQAPKLLLESNWIIGKAEFLPDDSGTAGTNAGRNQDDKFATLIIWGGGNAG